MAHLLIAHPGHELLLQGWISRNQPVVHILTDGTGHFPASTRVADSARFIDEIGGSRGSIFGRLSDREAYAMLVEQNDSLLFSLAAELAADLSKTRPAMLVTDSAEGYNPIHDLCRLIGGAAIAMAGVGTKQYEYPVVRHPSLPVEEIVIELDPAAHSLKMQRAHARAETITDIIELLSRHGEDAYRRETLCSVGDWAAIEHETAPLYEQWGEERVGSGLYAHVIREREHLLPLRDALRARVEERACAF